MGCLQRCTLDLDLVRSHVVCLPIDLLYVWLFNCGIQVSVENTKTLLRTSLIYIPVILYIINGYYKYKAALTRHSIYILYLRLGVTAHVLCSVLLCLFMCMHVVKSKTYFLWINQCSHTFLKNKFNDFPDPVPSEFKDPAGHSLRHRSRLVTVAT